MVLSVLKDSSAGNTMQYVKAYKMIKRNTNTQNRSLISHLFTFQPSLKSGAHTYFGWRAEGLVCIRRLESVHIYLPSMRSHILYVKSTIHYILLFNRQYSDTRRVIVFFYRYTKFTNLSSWYQDINITSYDILTKLVTRYQKLCIQTWF